jgi:rfaE bifunctional protein nucleotidyltransferase chain/domain
MSADIVPRYVDLAARLEAERAAGRTIALANGCFDLLHVGHVRLVAEARRSCDVLVVALNTDESVRRNKGEGRPAVPLDERMEVVAALAGVDYVTSFDEVTAAPMIRALRPHLLVKGTDRSETGIPPDEAAALEALGARVALCGDPKTHSSTDLIARRRRPV